MRRNLSLYIDGQLADTDAESLVLLNYRQTDMTAPAAVYNSYSQQVSLPLTERNNRIFGHIRRSDHRTGTGFNAMQRTPFMLLSDTGEVVESGYIKLGECSTSYSVTLYGSLGGFLFGLMYNADGTRRSLADLDFEGGDDELDFVMTRDAVRAAWRHAAGLDTSDDRWGIINFAPAYNGLPDEFDTKKALCSVNCYGVAANDGFFKARRGHVLCDLEQDVDEWAASDLRSYLQRPVVSMKRVIDAICDPDNNGGYNVSLDPTFFNASNPHYSKAWLTLPMLNTRQLPVSSESGTLTFADGDPILGINDTRVNVTDAVLKGDYNGRYVFSLEVLPTMSCPSTADLLAAWERPDVSGRAGGRIAVMYQLMAYDADGVLVGGSKVALVSTHGRSTDSAALREKDVTPAGFVTKFNAAYGTILYTYAPEWNPGGDDTIYEDTSCLGDWFAYSGGGYVLKENSINKTLTLTCEAYGVAKVVLRRTILGVLWSTTAASGTGDYNQVPLSYTYTTGGAQISYNGEGYKTVGGLDYAVNRSGTVHSGAQITKALLLGGTQTPADYLLSYIKRYGLYITIDRATRTVSIMGRDTFYGDTTPISLEGRIDVDSVRQQPCSVTDRWYDFAEECEGAFLDSYRQVYGRPYGLARVNTGYEFNADHNEVMKDSVFKGAAEVLAHNKYFVRVSEQGKPMPSPFLDGGKFTLWNGKGETLQKDIITATDAAAVEYLNPVYQGYDLSFMPKPEFRDKDGKGLDGTDVLLFLDGKSTSAYYNRYTLTDDNGLMMQFNDGTPCWLLGQHTLEENADYVIGAALPMPRFRRFRDAEGASVVDSMEYGTPAEIDNPAISVGATVNIYSRRWASYFADLMDVDGRMMTCKVRLGGLGQVGTEMMRRFWWYDGALWVLSAIKNYAPGTAALTECSFVKVKDIDNYSNGQS